MSGRRKRARSLKESEVVLLLLLHMMLKAFLINLTPCIIDGVRNIFMPTKRKKEEKKLVRNCCLAQGFRCQCRECT